LFATRRILTALLLVFLLSGSASAEYRGGSFRLWGHSARDLAMGGAATLMAPGLESLFNQPASLVGLDGLQVGACVQRPAGGVELSLSSVAVGMGSGLRPLLTDERTPTSSRAAALTFQHLGATLADGSGWGEWTAAGALAFSPQHWFSLGVRGSISGGGSDDGLDEGTARSVSAGMRAVLFHPGFELGWVAEDIYHRFSWQDQEPRRRASSQLISVAGLFPGGVSLELLGRWNLDSLESWALGSEWEPWAGKLYLRGGLLRQLRVEESFSPSFGFGIKHGSLQLDYGFQFNREEGPGSVHRLSMMWAGGSS
jgi:hypothetical protein